MDLTQKIVKNINLVMLTEENEDMSVTVFCNFYLKPY